MPEEPNLPVVETTPAVNTPEASTSASDSESPSVTPVGVTEERLVSILSDFEKRLSQKAKDTARSTVNKAMGVPKPTATATAPVPAPTPTDTKVEATPDVPTTTETTDAPTDPIVVQAQELLQADGVDVKTVNPVVLEAYRIQANVGVHIKPTDPEIQMIDGSTMYTYLRTTAEAAEALKNRMIQEGTYQTKADIEASNTFASTPGLISGAVPTKLPHEGKSGSQTIEMFFQGK